MRYIILVFIALLRGALLYGQSEDCDLEIKGRIFDLENKSPLPFSTISVLGTDQGAIADKNGHFLIEGICDGEVHLEVSYLGYKTIVHHHDFHHDDPKIYLAADQTEMESVIIEDSRIEEIQSLSVQRMELEEITLVNNSIADLTEKLSGVSLLRTGSNIAKPIIHGLHSNRILVINNEVRHAYQVWGEEHAPEIDPSNVDEIEVVKGAATVKYGPEALGGVILYNSDKPAFDEKLNGSINTSYITNGRAGKVKLNLGHGSHRFAWNVDGFGNYQGDLETPDYVLSNTGKREFGGSFKTLLHRPKFDLEVSGSYFDQELAILRASILGNLNDYQNAIDRGTPQPIFPQTYDIQNPKQVTEHGLLKSNLSLFLGDHVLTFLYAIQKNDRLEFDVRRGELNDRPVIDLNLISHTAEVDWIQPQKDRWNGNSGVQFFKHNSVNTPGSNPVNFIPDYELENIGAYSVQSFALDRTVLEAGVRFDYQTMDVADTIRETTIYSNELSFSNATFTIGARYAIRDDLSFFVNVGSAWRPPNVAELYSFGYRHSRIQFGLWRYEFNPGITTPLDRVLDENDRLVPIEQSFKLVSGIDVKHDRLTAELLLYANRINNYIFWKPFGLTVNVAGAFPYDLFDQTNALFLGTDWDIRFKHSPYLISELKASYVHARELGRNQAFTLIPPLSVLYSLNYEKNNWDLGLYMNQMARQWNAPNVISPREIIDRSVDVSPGDIFNFTAPPDGYLIFGLNSGYSFNQLNINLKVDNLFNKSYRVPTDRLRDLAHAVGRNFTFSIGYQF